MKKVTKAVLLVFISLVALIIFSFQIVFDVPEQPQQLLLGQEQDYVTPICYHNTLPKPIDKDGKLNLLVWNIYKQNRDNWETALNEFSHDSQLLLLQEARLTKTFISWIERQDWGSNYVQAFSAFNTSAGIINLASEFPIIACAYGFKEPWLRLPKAGLYARYLLSNNEELAVVNLHAINFTLGTKEYEQQLNVLKKELLLHKGPIILAGDFNTWNQDRFAQLRAGVNELGLKKIEFEPDHRKRFVNGLPLDHVFYKGLQAINAKAPITDASDHNPLIISFMLSE